MPRGRWEALMQQCPSVCPGFLRLEPSDTAVLHLWALRCSGAGAGLAPRCYPEKHRAKPSPGPGAAKEPLLCLVGRRQESPSSSFPAQKHRCGCEASAQTPSPTPLRCFTGLTRARGCDRGGSEPGGFAQRRELSCLRSRRSWETRMQLQRAEAGDSDRSLI